MHNTRAELLLTLNDLGATHFCVAPTARPGASYDMTPAVLVKKSKKAARGVRFKSGLGIPREMVCACVTQLNRLSARLLVRETLSVTPAGLIIMDLLYTQISSLQPV